MAERKNAKEEESGKDLNDLSEMIHHCAAKISFIGGFFSQGPAGSIVISEKQANGACYLLQDIEDNLESISDEIFKTYKAGKIKEVDAEQKGDATYQQQ